MRDIRQHWKSRGSALVEFSLVAFFLIVMLFSTIEFERMLLVYTTVADCARAGARYAIVNGADSTNNCGPGSTTCGTGTNTTTGLVVNVVQTFASTSLLDSSKLTINVTYPDGTNTTGSQVRVTVQYPYDPFVGWFKSPLSVNLTTTTQGIIVF